MMIHRFTLPSVAAFALLLALGFIQVAPAGTIRDDRADQLYKDRAQLPQFAAVGYYNSGRSYGSVTLIDPDWALTAAHVVDSNMNGTLADDNATGQTLSIGGNFRHVSEVFVPTGVGPNRGWNGDIGQGFDLALVHLATPITTITPAKLYTNFQELGKQITMVGYGRSGTGSTGATGSSGTKRAGDNIVDRLATFSNGATGLKWDFDQPSPRIAPNQYGSSTPLNLEYQIAPGDSGGGSFLEEDGAWYLAGVHSGVYNYYSYPGTGTDGSTYGDATLVTRVSAYQQFIFDHIPDIASASVCEPASLGLISVMTLMTLRRRRRVLT